MKVSRRSVQTYIALAKRLSPRVIERVKGTDLVDNFSELNALSLEAPEDQLEVLDLVLLEKAPNIRAAAALHHNNVDVTSPDEKHFAAFVRLWSKCSKKARRQIRAHLQREAE